MVDVFRGPKHSQKQIIANKPFTVVQFDTSEQR